MREIAIAILWILPNFLLKMLSICRNEPTTSAPFIVSYPRAFKMRVFYI